MEQLLALREKKTGLYSRIFSSREELEAFCVEHGVRNCVVGLVTFTELCPVVSKIEIPWGEGFEQLASRYEQSGSGETVEEAIESSVRDTEGGEARTPKKNKRKRA